MLIKAIFCFGIRKHPLVMKLLHFSGSNYTSLKIDLMETFSLFLCVIFLFMFLAVINFILFSFSFKLLSQMRIIKSISRCDLIMSDSCKYDEETNYKCGICFSIFRNKAAFFGHLMSPCGKTFLCCKCNISFKTLSDLYEHSDKHKSEDSEEIEEVVLDYDGQLVSIPKQNLVETNELLFVLDDAQCVNEVVIEDQPYQKSDVSEAVRIVQLEHGYMLRNDEENYDEPSIVTKVRRSPNKKIYNSPKPKANILKRRHELPDFTSSNYVYLPACEDIDVPVYKCLRCEQLFINKFVFFRHIEKGKCYINNCDVCTASFSKNSDFYLHYVVSHTDRAICNFCYRTFMYEKNVKEHMLRHLDQFRHRCEECNKGFYTVREYRNHYKNRHMGIRHKCDICSRTFADEYYFKRHVATHNSNVVVELDVTS
ncbi:hypothetical protein HHI36_018433 [Cryptolaemus montrouzieri]|uniref:C2H2-type domain-containing protein n=1 Tax=Cryptolaemus montrouzieri TaxID=559131 RepID=A0ABD2NZY6_9CUCU